MKQVQSLDVTYIVEHHSNAMVYETNLLYSNIHVELVNLYDLVFECTFSMVASINGYHDFGSHRGRMPEDTPSYIWP